MKQGDIVRRKTIANGIPFGPYLRVQHVEGNVVLCEIIGEDIPNVKYRKTSLVVLKHTSLCVSEAVLERMQKGYQCIVKHDVTKHWHNAAKNEIKIITFYCKPKMYKYTFVLDEIFEYDGRVTCIINKVLK